MFSPTPKTPDFLSSHSSHHWARTGPGHGVQFYRNDAQRIRQVTEFLVEGLKVGQPVVAIVAPANLRRIARALSQRGFPPTELEKANQLFLLDAQATLASLMNAHAPDPARFRAVIGGALDRAGGRRRLLRAYGEMVDLLWKDGKAPAAVRLEQMWNALAVDYHFALLCGYSADNFTGTKRDTGFEDVCSQHHVVVPTEWTAQSE